MLEPSTPPILYPGLPMARFGLTDFLDPKYRIIWAPSRFVTLTGRERTMTVPMYVDTVQVIDGIKRFIPAMEPVGEFWILEGWKSVSELTRLTEDEWNADAMMLNTGPYPKRGDFVRHETLSCNPCQANIEKLISWIEAGGQRRHIDNVLACQENLERSILDKKSKRKALIGDAMRPWGMEAFSAAGGSRMTKTLPGLKSREECGLPAEGVTRAIRPMKREVFEVMTEA